MPQKIKMYRILWIWALILVGCQSSMPPSPTPTSPPPVVAQTVPSPSPLIPPVTPTPPPRPSLAPTTLNPTATSILRGTPGAPTPPLQPSVTSTTVPPPNLTLAPTASPAGAPTITPQRVSGPVLVYDDADRVFAAGEVNGQPKTLTFSLTTAQPVAVFDAVGALGLDTQRGLLVIDQGQAGGLILDARTGAIRASVTLPAAQVMTHLTVAPLADPTAGRVLFFRDHNIYLVDSLTGQLHQTIPFAVPHTPGSCGITQGPLAISHAKLDPVRRLLYLDFVTYVCTPHIGWTLVTYDLTTQAEVGRTGGSVVNAAPWDGALYGTSFDRMVIGFRWILRDGKPQRWTSDWAELSPGLFVDVLRQRVYEYVRGSLRVLDKQTLAPIQVIPLGIDGALVGLSAKTDQLVFLTQGGLRLLPLNGITAPAPTDPAPTQPPTQAVTALALASGWPQDRTLLAVWDDPEATTCQVLGVSGGTLLLSRDAGVSWSRPWGGLSGTCERVTSLAVSPRFGQDGTLWAGILGVGVFKTSDGGRLWQPSSQGLSSLSATNLLVSPGYPADATLFAVPRPGQKLQRSRDGGQTWQTLAVSAHRVAMSGEFDQDRTLAAVTATNTNSGVRFDIQLSRDAGETWTAVGVLPGSDFPQLLSLAPKFAQYRVMFAVTTANETLTLHRSADGGATWQTVLSGIPAQPWHMGLTYAPNIEVNRPVFLVAGGALYRSGDGGLSWKEMAVPGAATVTAVAVSPTYAKDRQVVVGTWDGKVVTHVVSE